ncbi:hypothetical protein [Xanthobacter sp. YC-JY1]|uniref:hypothetical protein n=1 Tax=Xanthobacter sp. YC-JY1 TaxID=2419844 RepID=UPI001F2A4508|nr:hypothetical protein [Xanthobacter sp. YC-JY1]
MSTDDELCEIESKGAWVLIPIDDALKLGPSVIKRCPLCNGRVRAHKESNNGMRAHFEHFEAHAGCPRSRGARFSGRVTRHPSAVA